MKVFPFLLALLTVTLSTLPCCPTDNCAGEEATAEHAESPANEETDVCSPFYSCASCIGFTFSGFKIVPEATFIPSDNGFAVFQQSFPTPFQQLIWQPPKIS